MKFGRISYFRADEKNSIYVGQCYCGRKRQHAVRSGYVRCYHFFGDGKTRLPFYRRRGLKKNTREFFFFIFSVDIFHLLEYTALSSGRRHRDRFFPSPKAIWIAPAATQSVTPTLLSSFHFLLAARTHTSARLETRDTGDTAVVGSFFFSLLCFRRRHGPPNDLFPPGRGRGFYN